MIATDRIGNGITTKADFPKRAALKYFGGKFSLAPWLIKHFPAHDTYLEPCGGAASVLLQKPRVRSEVYNDLDSRVVNFFQVLRDHEDEFIRRARLTPWAEAEYELGRDHIADDPIEDARRFYMSCHMSISGGPYMKGQNPNSGFRYRKDTPSPWQAVTDQKHLRTIAARFEGVTILCRDALRVIEDFLDVDRSLVYFDPPYARETRRHSHYRHETDSEFHTRAAELLHQHAGYVVVSGYRCQLYDDLYMDWLRVDRRATVNTGAGRIESIWLSPRTVAALDKPVQLDLFDDQREGRAGIV